MVVALLNNSGSVVEAYSYDPFGKPTVHTAAGTDNKWLTSDDTTASTPVSAYGNWQMFTARQWDAESGLYYYRARMYHPTIGRFLQPDPMAQFMQLASTLRLSKYDFPGTYLSPMGMNTFLRNDPIGRFLQVHPTGRFLQAYPLGFPAELNLYTYGGNNSINYLDPYGLGFLSNAWNWIKNVFLIVFGPSGAEGGEAGLKGVTLTLTYRQTIKNLGENPDYILDPNYEKGKYIIQKTCGESGGE